MTDPAFTSWCCTQRRPAVPPSTRPACRHTPSARRRGARLPRRH